MQSFSDRKCSLIKGSVTSLREKKVGENNKLNEPGTSCSKAEQWYYPLDDLTTVNSIHWLIICSAEGIICLCFDTQIQARQYSTELRLDGSLLHTIVEKIHQGQINVLVMCTWRTGRHVLHVNGNTVFWGCWKPVWLNNLKGKSTNNIRHNVHYVHKHMNSPLFRLWSYHDLWHVNSNWLLLSWSFCTNLVYRTT